MKRIPIRMCLACRKHFPKKDLIRIVKNKENQIFADKTFKAEGRGAYVCNNNVCLANLKKAHKLNKYFKCEIPAEFYENLKGEI